MEVNKARKSRWYFGGLASAGAACCTHPLDLLKVHMQTGGGGSNTGMVGRTIGILKGQGFLALYSGLSASLLRQATYSTTRFAIYDVTKQRLTSNNEKLSFPATLALAGVAGACGGFVGTPGDMINVRMQNDIKLPKEQRRNYRHAIDGVLRVYREEGFHKLFNGVGWASSRAVLVTVGQLGFYDVIKAQLLSLPYFEDNLTTHFTSSFFAGGIATAITQPLDVLKTRAMNAQPGEFSGPLSLIKFTAKQGPLTFFKGFVPAFVRLGPHTIITFVLFEQLRLRFGYLQPMTIQETSTIRT